MDFGDRYGPLDRLLHRVAFRAGRAQHALSDVEEMLFADRLAETDAEDPVFITALPRSGTTILLKLLWQTGSFASHTYQDMPFVLCPLLWSRYSQQFSKEIEPTERAHGDGLKVSGNSPEAFEEMVWKYFWPSHYETNRILPWGADDHNREFTSFFQRHMQKVISVRRAELDGAESAGSLRYLSKNNLNISRLSARPAPLQKGTFLIPYRAPVQHAASMLRQHKRFLQIHKKDPFVREYMEAIGHHEFGRGLKPVNFCGWLDEEPIPDPSGLSFWLRYWIAAYRYVLDNTDDDVTLISYQRLTDEPQLALSRLAEAVGIPEADVLAYADDLRPPRTHAVESQNLPEPLTQKAENLRALLAQEADV